jgi:O-glycosyl hydrolase
VLAVSVLAVAGCTTSKESTRPEPQATHVVSGAITPDSAGRGAILVLSGAAAGADTADGAGAFSFGGLLPGDYTITPGKPDYEFAPASRMVTVTSGDVVDVAFVASRVAGPRHSISGTISGAGGNGATVALTGAAGGTTTAAASGAYAFPNLLDGTYTVTPTRPSFTFTPARRTVDVAGGNRTGVDFSSAAVTPNLTVDGASRFQRIDGLGVNANVDNWDGGALRAGLDLLIDRNGASLFRVVRDPMDWVASESLVPQLHALDATTLQQVYETPAMQDIWSTIAYLNQKGLGGGQIELNFMGWTPTWLGGSGAYGSVSRITAGKEAAFATMVASLVYYGRRVKNLDFTLLAPLNELDHDGKEGPQVGPTQYVTILRALIAELDAMGLGEMRIVGPETAGSPTAYLAPMMADATVAGRVDHLAFHSYGSSAASPGTAYAGKNYWLTETSAWCSTCDQNGAPAQGEWAFARETANLLLGDLANGFAAVAVWEGYDGYYYHHDSSSSWGLLAYDGATYTPRKRFYVYAQLHAFVRPGMRRVAVTHSVGGLGTVLAFTDEANGKVAIVGYSGSSAATLHGRLSNLPFAVTSLRNVQTSASADLSRGPDVPVSGEAFTITIPSGTFFSLAN